MTTLPPVGRENVAPPEKVEVPVLESVSAPESVPPVSGRYVPDKSGISLAVRPEIPLTVTLFSDVPLSWSMSLETAMLLV